MVGLGLVALLALAAYDVGRPGNATEGSLLCLRAVGGAGLGTMAVLALVTGAPIAALVAGLGATPLLGGLVAPLVRARVTRAAPAATQARPAAESRYVAPAEERRAA